MVIAKVWLLNHKVVFFLTSITHYLEAVFPNCEIFTVILKRKQTLPYAQFASLLNVYVATAKRFG